MNKSQLTGILIVGMTLGTAWAVRGQFGHEQGAAWAGAIGTMGLIMASGRKDWYRKILSVAFAGAIGWGITGMISYGMVVGYGRSLNFPNAFYGLTMLFVIGGLFGLIGGGLTGLALETSEEKKVKWSRLMAEMVAGGLIIYGFFVQQIGVLMTPPRSEAWAICLGAGLAMLWYMARNNFNSALRVALITSLGAGFGFAFGNFLQTAGTILKINFNMWNVMEYSIGFFGGTSLAYSVFTSKWPETEINIRRWEKQAAFILVIILVPLIVFRESMTIPDIAKRLASLPNVESVANISSWTAAIILCAGIVTAWFGREKLFSGTGKNTAKYLFAGFFATYIIFSYLLTGVLGGMFHLNHHLYIVNYIVVFILLNTVKQPLTGIKECEMNYRNYRLIFFGILVIIAILAFVSITINPGIGGAHNRFEL